MIYIICAPEVMTLQAHLSLCAPGERAFYRVKIPKPPGRKKYSPVLDTTVSRHGTSMCTYAIEPPCTERYARWCERRLLNEWVASYFIFDCLTNTPRIRQGRFQLNCIQQHRKILQHRADYHENVEYRVHPLFGFAQSVEDGADGISDAAQKQQQKSRQSHGFHGLFREGNHRPAHADVADHGKDAVLFEINGRQRAGQNRQHPFKAEQPPAQRRMGGPDGGQHHGGIGAADQKVDGAVIDDLHHLFAHAGLQTVVDAGNGEHGDEGGAVDGTADDAVIILIQGRLDNAGQQHNDT